MSFLSLCESKTQHYLLHSHPHHLGCTCWCSAWLWSTAAWSYFKYCLFLFHWTSYWYLSSTSCRDGYNGVLGWGTVWMYHSGMYINISVSLFITYTHIHHTPHIRIFLPTFSLITFHTGTDTQMKSVHFFIVALRMDWEKQAKMVKHTPQLTIHDNYHHAIGYREGKLSGEKGARYCRRRGTVVCFLVAP